MKEKEIMRGLKKRLNHNLKVIKDWKKEDKSRWEKGYTLGFNNCNAGYGNLIENFKQRKGTNK